MPAPTPFTVAVPDQTVDRILTQVAAYPWEMLRSLPDWQAGIDLAFLRRACQRWVGGYEWRAAEAELNRYPQYRVQLDGIDLHFLHEPGSGRDPRPVLLIHGWPSSVYDFSRVIEPLAHPERFGGDADAGVSVIVPSLPGYGWSGSPPQPHGRRHDAAVLHQLMIDILGYRSYVAQGGDWGSYIAGWLAVDHPDSVDGIHVTALNLRPPGAPAGATSWPKDFTAEEQTFLSAEAHTQQQLLGYALIQASQPQTLGVAMTDNPVGQAAWILEKYHAWTTLPDGQDIDAVFGMDRLLTQVMVYLVTNTFVTATWAYPGLFTDPPTLDPGQRVAVPTAFAAFPDPLVPTPPRSFADRVYDITAWTTPARGGHFPALQEPDVWTTDLQAFLSDLPRKHPSLTDGTSRTR